MLSPYSTTRLLMFRAARPMIWIRLRARGGTFLVGIENPDEPDFGNVEPFPEQVDSHQHIELAQPELADDLGAFQRLDIGMEIAGLDAPVGKELGEFFGKFLGQRGDEGTVAPGNGCLHLADHIISLPGDRANLDIGVHQSGRADDLFHEPVRMFQLVIAWRCGDEDRACHVLFELMEPEGPLSYALGSRNP